jgi:hypothetical protein
MSKNYIQEVMKVWKYRHSKIVEKYSEDALKKFIAETYASQSHYQKEAITRYIRDYDVDLEAFGPTEMSAALDYQKLQRSENAIKSNFYRSDAYAALSDEEKENRQATTAAAAKITRASKFVDDSNSTALQKSYKKGIIEKGRSIGLTLGLDVANMTEKELSLLSGQSKRRSFSMKTDEEKYETKITWKQRNLQHINVKTLLIASYPEFSKMNIEAMNDQEIEKWYSNYNSLLSIKRLQKSKPGRKIQRKFSIKMNKFMTCRSNLEAEFVNILDDHELVSYFEIEPFSTKYRRAGELNDRRYLVDFLVIFSTGKSLLVEIKPDYLFADFEKQKGQYVRPIFEHPLLILDPSKHKDKINELFEHYSK